MARKVYKYGLTPGINTLKLPMGTQILSVHHQNDDTLCMWGLVFTENEEKLQDRVFVVAMTGEEIDDVPNTDLTYIGTAHLLQGRIVAHVFEQLKLMGG